MGKGFDVFMKNPYWECYYNNAPSEVLKKYIKIEFENNPFVVDQIDPDYAKKRKALSDLFSNEDWQYLIDHTLSGQAKTEYRKHLV